jgi:hypothetical protein
MVSLTTQKEFRELQTLPFCYLCGKSFVVDDEKDRDHVPPQSAIAKCDREPLLLPTHVRCNGSHHLIDEKIGQLIALRRGEAPRKDVRRLHVALSPDATQGAVTNLNIDQAVWRWIAGFHAALYRSPPIGIKGSLVTPLPRAQNLSGRFVMDSLKPQHQLFVRTIKENRARNNLDRISCNKGKVLYECVWCQADKGGLWFCMYALDIYDWKDLGRTGIVPARGCAGFYIMQSGDAPINAAKSITSRVIIPIADPLDPFGR